MEAGASVSVSAGAGTLPRWRGDSRELIYRGGDGFLVGVEVSSGPTIRVGASKRLDIPTGAAWDITRDGRQFLALGNTSEPHSYNVILDWQASLKQ